MPIYAFRCSKCEHEFEELVTRMDDTAPCPACGSKKVDRGITTPADHRGESCKGDTPPCATGGTCGGGACPFN